ncbi:MAG: hypothetical protein IPK76_25545 [Lewinellaceae bacterium]|nr:hypothetical protein [Lewinellaceae bacterium]
MMAYHAPNYLNIIHLTNRVIQIRSGQRLVDGKELETLETQIQATNPLTERDWLLDMLSAS